MTIHPVALLKKFGVAIALALKPLGIWGLAALALIDSSLIPMPVSMDGVLVGYVKTNHSLFFAYCLVAAVASAIGSLVPYYVGRAGGELFLLKRVNRERYERMRDKFEEQEFLAIMIPAMSPPPMPIKLFEFAAGVFEMKPLPFMLAIFCGKFIQFMVCAILFILFGDWIIDAISSGFKQHSGIILSVAGIAVVVLGIYIMRELFGSGKEERFPVEDEQDEDEGTV